MNCYLIKLYSKFTNRIALGRCVVMCCVTSYILSTSDSFDPLILRLVKFVLRNSGQCNFIKYSKLLVNKHAGFIKKQPNACHYHTHKNYEK